MVDIRLISILPPSPVSQPPAAQPITPQGGSPLLPQLPNGTVLSGFIVNRDTQGNPILRTPGGDITFASNFFLKIGSEVVIRIQQQGPRQNAHIVTVNGLPPEQAESQSAFSDEPEVIVGGRERPVTGNPQAANRPNTAPIAATPLTGAPVTTQQTAGAAPASPLLPVPRQGQSISAIIVTPAVVPPTANTESPIRPQLPGTSLIFSVLGVNREPSVPAANSPIAQITSPQAPPTAKSSLQALSSLIADAPTSAQPAQGNTPPAASAGMTASPASTGNVAGQTIPFQFSNQEAASANFRFPLGQAILATVTRQHEDGSVTLDSPLGSLRAPNLAGLRPGEQLSLRVGSVANPSAYTTAIANVAESEPPAPLTQLAGQWTSLQQIVQFLGLEESAKFVPAFPGAGNIAPAAIPGAVTQASSQLMFFFAALGGGNFREWLGQNNVRLLEQKGFGPLLKKAEGEFSLLARQFADVPPGQWQSAFIPVLAAGELLQMRAFIKREKKKDGNGRPTGLEDTRFVLEMELSQLGEMQMDGLVRRMETQLQFDLIIRSHEKLPADVQQDIREIYQNTAELTGYVGSLAFEDRGFFPVHPMEDIAPHPFDGINV